MTVVTASRLSMRPHARTQRLELRETVTRNATANAKARLGHIGLVLVCRLETMCIAVGDSNTAMNVTEKQAIAIVTRDVQSSANRRDER